MRVLRRCIIGVCDDTSAGRAPCLGWKFNLESLFLVHRHAEAYYGLSGWIEEFVASPARSPLQIGKVRSARTPKGVAAYRARHSLPFLRVSGRLPALLCRRRKRRAWSVPAWRRDRGIGAAPALGYDRARVST